VRAQFAVRIRRFAVAVAPLIPIALTIVVHGKRW
jgi:hypothetical protein